VFLNVRFPRLFGKAARMIGVSRRGVGVVRGFFVLSTFVVLSRFPMMASGFCMVL
jgi:hypothetical protein